MPERLLQIRHTWKIKARLHNPFVIWTHIYIYLRNMVFWLVRNGSWWVNFTWQVRSERNVMLCKSTKACIFTHHMTILSRFHTVNIFNLVSTVVKAKYDLLKNTLFSHIAYLLFSPKVWSHTIYVWFDRTDICGHVLPCWRSVFVDTIENFLCCRQ